MIRKVKNDVYGKRQTAKMKLLPALLSCVYSRVKLFVFAKNSRRRYSIFVCFIYRLKEKNSKSELIIAVCRLPLTSCLTSLRRRRVRRLVKYVFILYLRMSQLSKSVKYARLSV